jgi:hypothetical protein
MALHLVRRLAGSDRAREVRRGIQYDPEPPRLSRSTWKLRWRSPA